MTRQIGIVQPVNGGAIFIVAPEREVAPLGVNARQRNALVVTRATRLYFVPADISRDVDTVCL